MAEDPVIRFTRAMNNPKNIRNIATSAHIHHGKCISKDSRLILENGSILTAEEIYEYCEKNGVLFENKDNEHIIYDVSKLGLNIFSLNKETNQIEKKPVSMAWKLVGGTTIKVKLRHGAEITTTPEHKYIVYRNSQILDVPAQELVLGDRIVCPSRLKIDSKIDLKQEFLFLLSQKNFYVNLEIKFYKNLKNNIMSYGIKEIVKKINSDLKPKSFYHGLWQNRFTLKDYLQICKLFNISSDNNYNNIDLIYFRTGKQRGGNSCSIKLPIKWEDFFYLAGLFFGDGSNSKFIVGKKQLGNEFLRICNDLNINCSLGGYKHRTPELITNMTVVEIMNSLFNYPKKQKSRNIRISQFLNKCPDSYVSKFLSGYFDADGTVEKSRSAISITSVSKQMIKDLHFLLLRFGCVGIINKENDTIYLSGFSAKNFNDNIGFNLNEKKLKAENLVSKISGSRVCDNIGLDLTSNGETLQVQKTLNNNLELSFIEVKSMEVSYEETVYDFTVPKTHNFVAEGIFMHNTALTDNLLAAAGLMSEKSAGDLDKGMATWQHADEQERLMTVDAANVSMIHDFNNEEFLINLIDTPGHVDFGGNVTRAMRAIDGTVVLVCASEGIMPQTETVVKQALRERVKPVLFLNKVDRLIKEMQYTPEQMQKRFTEIILQFNRLIEQIAEPEFKEKWKVGIQEGSVAFGSARENWALSFSFMQKKKVNFKDILALYEMDLEERKKWVWEKAPLHEVVLDMVIKHLPNPVEAQKYRVPRIWKGDLESEFGKSLLNCDKNGKVAFCVTRVMIDPKTGREISAGRLYSGTVKGGMEVYLSNAKQKARVQQVFMYNGIKTQMMNEVVAGNVLALAGLKAEAGETITEGEEHPFEELKHIFEPVITKAIEPTKPQDLAKVVEVLKAAAKEDPSIKIKIDEQTGECLMSGMGELHLEIIENRIKTEKGVDIKSSPPIVVYRETISKKSPEAEGKTPNKHNRFYLIVEPLPDNLYNAIKNGDLPSGRVKKKDRSVIDALIALGIDTKDAQKFRAFYNGNAFVDNTRGIVQIGEVIDLILDAFEQVMDGGVLAREPCTKLLVTLNDCKLHEDSIHRGPAQIYPAIREGLRDAMNLASPVIFEPMQVLQIESVVDHMGSISKLVANKRGQLLDMNQEGNYLTVKAKMPVAEMFGLSSDLRSATEGRGTFYVADQEYQKLPLELQNKLVQQIRQRKGLSENQ
ncbi:elongation factor EF-2 [Candidatus Woesearchaeota archaeon]|nr:elongation factor EF-2 [Candidatus Woesearchaeota archaeon]